MTLARHLYAHDFDASIEQNPELLHAALRRAGWRYYHDKGTMPVNNFQKRVLDAMIMRWPQHTAYVIEQLFK